MKNTLKNDFLSSRVRYIPLEHIVPNPHQPRRDFDLAALAELADSIRQYGVLQPATVRTRGRDYELVAGERRFRAAKLAGLKELPCLIAQVGEEDSALLALMENLQRRDLNYMEEAAAIAQLVQRWGLSQEVSTFPKDFIFLSLSRIRRRSSSAVTSCGRFSGPWYGYCSSHVEISSASSRSDSFFFDCARVNFSDSPRILSSAAFRRDATKALSFSSFA